MKTCIEIATTKYMFVESWHSRDELELRGHLAKPLNFKGEESEAQRA